MPADIQFKANHLLLSKAKGLFSRFLDIFRLFPVRLTRIGEQLILPLRNVESIAELSIGKAILWYFELIFCIADLFGVPEVYESLVEIIKFNSRPLNANELSIANHYFGNNLNYKRIRIDDCDLLFAPLFNTAYVSFNCINSKGPLNNRVFVHELIHVWQFQQVGSRYIARSIAGQLSSEGYDYGGLMTLRKAIRSNRGLSYFNYEQQGDVLADHYAIASGYKPRWSIAGESDLWLYDELLSELNENRAVLV